MHKVQMDNLHVQFVPQARNVKILVLVTQKVFLLHVLIVILVIIKMNKGKTIANRARLVIILELLLQLRVVPIVFLANTRSVTFLLQWLVNAHFSLPITNPVLVLFIFFVATTMC
jgi:membrane glycosyltransferase